MSSKRTKRITIVGAGAHRLLGILRGTLEREGVMEGSELRLYDLDRHRAEVMARMLEKTPEYKDVDCVIRWDLSLEEALEGADIVGVIMPAGSIEAHVCGHEPSLRHGFLSSDNITPNGAMAALRIAPTLMNIARKMERYCPEAWLVNFVNPVGILSGMMNNHTSIRTLGVCQGFTNHLADIPRLFGEDRHAGSELRVKTAGINHLSYIVEGTWHGRDLLEVVDERLKDPRWEMPHLRSSWSEASKANIRESLERLVETWREVGVLIFSSEPDGMVHLKYDEAVQRARQKSVPRTSEDVAENMRFRAEARKKANQEFEAVLGEDLDDAFWRESNPSYTFRINRQDIFTEIFSALSGYGKVRIATSLLNNGAIANLPDRHVVEYTHDLSENGIELCGPPMEIPRQVYGFSASFSGHQTMVGDALASGDPEWMARALLAYPIMPFSASLRNLYKELFTINRPHLPEDLRRVPEFL